MRMCYAHVCVLLTDNSTHAGKTHIELLVEFQRLPPRDVLPINKRRYHIGLLAMLHFRHCIPSTRRNSIERIVRYAVT